MMLIRLVGLVLLVGLAAAGLAAWARKGRACHLRGKRLPRTFREGNFKDAYEGFRKLALDPADDARKVGQRPEHGHGVPAAAQPRRRDRRLPGSGDRGPQEPTGGCCGARRRTTCRSSTSASSWPASSIADSIAAAARWSTAVERDRVRALQLMVQAMPLALKDENHAEVGNFLLALAEHVAEQPRLWRVVAAAVPDRPDRPARLRGRLGLLSPDRRRAGRRRRQAGLPSRAQELRGGRDRRPALAVVPAAGGRVQPAAAQRGADAVRRVPAEPVRRADDGPMGLAFRPHGDRRHARRTRAAPTPCTRWAKTRPSPGWPPASSGSSCPTSSTTSRSSSRSPPSRRPATAIEALEQLAQIFENRRQYPKAADYWRRLLKEYPNANRPAAQELAAAARPDRRQLGPLRAGRRPSPPAAGPRSSIASATAGRSSSPPTRSRSKSCWTT